MIQLGTRWLCGGEPPARLPQIVVNAVHDVEGERVEQSIDISAWHWTLTWLEGRPVIELDDGTLIEYDPTTDEAVISQTEDFPDE